MNREEIIKAIKGEHNIAFSTTLATTVYDATAEIRKAEKTEENINNLICGSATARDAGILLTRSNYSYTIDYKAHRANNPNKIEFGISFGRYLRKIVGTRR